jgi:hypothetical protein
MKKLIKIVLIYILPVILLIIVGFYLFAFKTSRLPYRNYSDFSTASGYIYLKVVYKDSILLTVMPNSWFYGSLTHYVHKDKYNVLRYLFKINMSNIFDVPIRVDRELYDICKYTEVDKRLTEKFEKIDILKSDLIQGDRLNDSLKRNEISALIYVLLKNKLKNCSNECESGVVVITEP